MRVHYYKLEKLAQHASTRTDCIASTKDYMPFETRRATKPNRQTAKRDATSFGQLVIYYGTRPERYSKGTHIADRSLTIKGKNLSSVYMPDPTEGIGYGDVKDTSDALVVRFSAQPVNNALPYGTIMELFIFEGAAMDRQQVFEAFKAGKLNAEITAAQQRAREEETPLK